MPKKRRYWGLVAPMPAPMLGEVVRGFEAMGLEGVWAPQLWGPPFLSLASAATVTSKLKLGTGVAVAFARSPLETACAALDLDLLSNGRCVLGLGPSVRWWNEDWFGVRYGKPIAHLRETIEVVRMILRRGHTGELGRWKGEYYDLNLSHFQTLSPPVREDIPIYVPAVYETACRLAGEIAEGLPGHPIWCEKWILERVVANVAKGLSRSGRRRDSFDLNIWLFVAPGPSKRECIEDARRTIAFYAKFRQYERYFTECGFGTEARAIAQAHEASDEAGMLRACTDAMVETFALVGPVDEVRARVDRIGEVTDSFCLCVPIYGLGPDKLLGYSQRIAAAFYLGS